MKQIIITLIVYFAMFFGFMFVSYAMIYHAGADVLKLSFSIMFFGGYFTTRLFDRYFK